MTCETSVRPSGWTRREDRAKHGGDRRERVDLGDVRKEPRERPARCTHGKRSEARCDPNGHSMSERHAEKHEGEERDHERADPRSEAIEGKTTERERSGAIRPSRDLRDSTFTRRMKSGVMDRAEKAAPLLLGPRSAAHVGSTERTASDSKMSPVRVTNGTSIA